MSFITANPEKLISAAAGELRKLGVQRPGWAAYVKTGVSRERPPQQEDWWEVRAAAVLRQLGLRTAGARRLARQYGGRKNRGHKPEHAFPGSGSVIREILQQLDAAGLSAVAPGKGRAITPKGRQLLAQAAKAAG